MILGQEDQKVGQWNVWSISMWKVCGVLVVCKLFDIWTLFVNATSCWKMVVLLGFFKTKICLLLKKKKTLFKCDDVAHDFLFIVLDFKSLQLSYNGYNQVVPKLIVCLCCSCWFYKGWWVGCFCGPRRDYIRKELIGKPIHDLFIQRHNKNINKSLIHKNIKIQ
jgi:hypothetical protein